MFYSVNVVPCKIRIFLVFYSHSRRQRPNIEVKISLNVFIQGYNKHSFSRIIVASALNMHPSSDVFLEKLLLRYSSLGSFSRVLQPFSNLGFGFGSV